MRPLGEPLFIYLIHFISLLHSVHLQRGYSTVWYYHSTQHGLLLKALDRTKVSS